MNRRNISSQFVVTSFLNLCTSGFKIEIIYQNFNYFTLLGKGNIQKTSIFRINYYYILYFKHQDNHWV